ncbi:hypothetical protein Vau01_106360 [Virgisporangium aurantiacum]|uniref:Uncharacterized protein n=1 Tax=Virgisporangium aurantiacum TaxID=175570 RepID=A0A8J3ZJG8_9ACTN|nr:hypothetical protein Vau01_106360 [Virgisporangium aurantiacum]
MVTDGPVSRGQDRRHVGLVTRLVIVVCIVLRRFAFRESGGPFANFVERRLVGLVADRAVRAGDAAGEFDQADAGHDNNSVDADRQQFGRGVGLSIAGRDTGHVVVGDVCGDDGNGDGRGDTDGGEDTTVDRHPRDEFDGDQQRDGWPRGNGLTDRVVGGVENIGDDRHG